ncbi:MAG TPA: ATP-dependent Clp protease proteolytic subunit [Alphaproteobacteria bacterium]|nr:ATP-dependent Clp protease proteolytic subunit [Alphaproteobacteria bacterium]
MKNNPNKTPDPQYISAEALDIFNRMQAASKSGSSLTDALTNNEFAALKKVVASAQKAGLIDPSDAPRTIPSVTEVEGGRERGYDLYSLLIKNRIVMVEGQVEDTMSSIVCASLLYMNSDLSGKDPKSPITMYVNSPGGSVLAGLAIYDVMRAIEAPITTIGMGMQASMGSILLVAGDERKMTRNSKYMIHQPLSGNGQSTQLTDIEIGADFTGRLKEDLVDIYVRHTGLNHDYWNTVLNRDTWLTADQAKEMGVISDIIVGTAKKTLHEDFSVPAARKDYRKSFVPTTAAEIKMALNSDVSLKNAAGAEIKSTMLRPELVTALSQFEEFWTPSLKALKQQQAAAAEVSNDDAKKARAPRKVKAPKQAM